MGITCLVLDGIQSMKIKCDACLGVMQEGCKMDASAVLYTSVKSARAAVAMLHQKEIKGVVIWARQLGGEVKFHPEQSTSVLMLLS